MLRTAQKFLTGLILCLALASSACSSKPAPVLVTPQVELPARPAMLPVQWRHIEGVHCLTDEEAKKLLIDTSRLWAHIEVLEGVIEAVRRNNDGNIAGSQHAWGE